jgi:hypothetical protein
MSRRPPALSGSDTTDNAGTELAAPREGITSQVHRGWQQPEVDTRRRPRPPRCMGCCAHRALRFTVLRPPGGDRCLVYSRLQQTVLNLRAAGWPPPCIYLYDELWVELIDPLFDVYEQLLGEGCSMAADLNCWCLRAPEESASTYVGQTFGSPHRDLPPHKCQYQFEVL